MSHSPAKAQDHPPGRTLADQLRNWPDERLAALLAARPDLTTPAPADSAQLAARASTKSSVWRVLDRLDFFELSVLEAIANNGLADVNATSVDAAVRHLSDLLLIWPGESAHRVVTAIAEQFRLPPGADAGQIEELLATLPPKARMILDHLDRTGTDGTVESIPARLSVATARTPTEELLARGLLVARDGRKLTLPWAVRVHLRGGKATRTPVDQAPRLALREVDLKLVDRQAAGAAFELVRRVGTLLDRWGTRPPGALKAGGVSVRDLKATAELLHLSMSEAGLVIEIAHAAGLVAIGSTDLADAVWLPTDGFDTWQAAPTEERWRRLVAAWLSSPRWFAKVGTRSADKPVNALSEGLERTWVVALRAGVLAELPDDAGLAAGTGLASLLDRLHWLHPRTRRGWDDFATSTVEEATFVGLVSRGALASFARRFLDDGDATLLAQLLPPPVDHVLLQADLTATAPGPLESELASQLALVADIESRGGATVYRFSDDSIRRGFDAGWSLEEMHSFVAAASKTPVPQGLSYLIDDVSRRFGVLRAGVAESFLRSDDEAALTELMVSATSLRLRRIAPTVVISDISISTLVPKLRELGFAPVVEALDGTVQVARADVLRARTPRPRKSIAQEVRAEARVAAVTAAIRAGDRMAATRPTRRAATSTIEVIELLREAALGSTAVLIGYVGSDGTVIERLVRPLSVEGGRLTAYDARSDSDREFAIHRITAATPA